MMAGRLEDGEDVRAVAGELGGDKRVGTIDQRDHCNHRRHTDHHAQQREHSAELVGPERLQGEPECFFGFHGEDSGLSVRNAAGRGSSTVCGGRFRVLEFAFLRNYRRDSGLE